VTQIEAEEGGSRVRELDRIAAFTDGVLAIAITLLVLSIDVPNVELEPGTTLDDKLLALWPDLFAYAVSFVVIGRYWVLHHRFFALLARYDGRLISLNLLFLGWVVLIPFVSNLLGDFTGHTAAVIAYAVVLSAVGLVNWVTVRYAIEHDLVARGVTVHHDLLGLALPTIFLASIPVALFSPRAAAVMWLVLLVIQPAAWYRRRRGVS
jgi:uncharacterized membrane protein